MLWFDEKSKSTVSSSHSSSTAMKWKKSLSVTIYESNNSDMKQDWDLLFHSNFFVVNFLGFAPLIFKCPVVSETSTIILHIFFSYFSLASSICFTILFLIFSKEFNEQWKFSLLTEKLSQNLPAADIKVIKSYPNMFMYICVIEMAIYHNAYSSPSTIFWKSARILNIIALDRAQ